MRKIDFFIARLQSAGYLSRMTTFEHATRSTHLTMISNMEAKTVQFIHALGFTCAAADCSVAQSKGLKAKAIKKADRKKWEVAAQSAGFTII